MEEFIILVLSRLLHERIRIGKDIFVSVSEISHGRVKLAFDAPKEIPIYREEVIARIEEEMKTKPLNQIEEELDFQDNVK